MALKSDKYTTHCPASYVAYLTNNISIEINSQLLSIRQTTDIPTEKGMPLERNRGKTRDCIVQLQVSNNLHHGIELFLMCTESCSSDWTFLIAIDKQGSNYLSLRGMKMG